MTKSGLKVEFTDSCWLWRGKLNKNGYGVIQISGKCHLAHRISYQLFNGFFKYKLGVLHRCDTRNCINPKHLFLGTQEDNNKDAANKNRVPFGEKHWNCKLSHSQVRKIFYLSDSNLRHVDIARMFGVGRQTISSILSGKKRSKEFKNA